MSITRCEALQSNHNPEQKMKGTFFLVFLIACAIIGQSSGIFYFFPLLMGRLMSLPSKGRSLDCLLAEPGLMFPSLSSIISDVHLDVHPAHHNFMPTSSLKCLKLSDTMEQYCFFYVFIYVQISFLSDIHKSIFLTSYKVQPYVSFIVVRLLKTVQD